MNRFAAFVSGFSVAGFAVAFDAVILSGAATGLSFAMADLSDTVAGFGTRPANGPGLLVVSVVFDAVGTTVAFPQHWLKVAPL